MTDINLEEIQVLIQKKIKDFDLEKIESFEHGIVIFADKDIAIVYGLKETMLNEMISIGDNYGIAIDLKKDYIGVALLNNDSKIKEGDTAKRLHKVFEVPVGDELLGKVINILGIDLNTGNKITTDKNSPIEKDTPPIIERKKIDCPVETGIKIIDSLLPIGKGQRELIIGDRQTGKTAIALNIILNQKDKNMKCIYVSIGQKNSNLINIYENLKKENVMSYTTIVSSSASDSVTLQYLTPYAAMSIAEEWLSKGKDVIIIFDDLSKHAVAYRTLSLLLNRPSGREAYPGDIFYLHSRLLERSCRLKNGGSITAIPIIETQNGDISSYIPTNVVSITDGQIFLTKELFNLDIKPAINIDFSVSRIGSSAQEENMKQVSKKIKSLIANYHELSMFSKFGDSFINDEKTKKIITRGNVLTQYFKQGAHDVFSTTEQIISLFLINNSCLDFTNGKKVNKILNDFFSFIEFKNKKILESLKIKKIFDDNIKKNILELFNQFLLSEQFEF